ncbi:hypothetical protein FQN49_003094 [Arthroderma sp. PD_2]|nr:hypothetical protein FQN49_003094 [Arthroderma sp. PD_2]
MGSAAGKSIVFDKVDMFTEIYLSHANGTIKDLVKNDKSHKISRKKIELQILEGIDNSQFPTSFRIIFYSMVLHTNTFDIYWLGQKNLLGLSKSSITRLKPDMSLLQNLSVTSAVDTPPFESSDDSGNLDAEEVEEGSIPGDGLYKAKVSAPFDPATDPTYSLVNGQYVRIGPHNVEFPDREGRPNGGLSNGKFPHPRYPTPNGTPVHGKETVAPIHHTNGVEEAAVQDKSWGDDILKDNTIDPSLITTVTNLPTNTPLTTLAGDPTQVDTPAATARSTPVPGPGGLKPKAPPKSKRGGGPKKQTPARPARTPKAKTGGKKATGAGSGTGAGVGKGKGKGGGGKGKGKNI